MRAIDTNVVVRLAMRDDAAQEAAARAILSEGAFVPLTVLLEIAWVLQSRYRYSRPALADSLRSVIELPGVAVSDREGVVWAIDRFEAGADFADMIHVVASAGATSFATFDRAIADAAGSASPVPIETLGG